MPEKGSRAVKTKHSFTINWNVVIVLVDIIWVFWVSMALFSIEGEIADIQNRQNCQGVAINDLQWHQPPR